ncbi:MAG TPA: hypothetical protein ENN28_03630 [Candidatus Uhrbacteria bacterium]|nr:hypothetical protein [Candidatus Uhrbacteria bacterium]
MKKQIKIFIFVILFTFFFVLPVSLIAQEPCETKYPDDGKCKTDCEAEEFYDDTAGLCTIGKCCHRYAEPVDITLQVPLFTYTKSQNIAEYIMTIYNTALYIVVPIIIVVLIFSGALWVLSGGDKELISKAKSRIISAFIGLGIVLFSYVILSFFGLTEFRSTMIEYIEPMPYPVLDGEFDAPVETQPAGITPPPIGAPPVAGKMPRIFQCDYKHVRFNCHSKTVCSSGCGTVSATMVLRYYGKNISVEQAVQHMANARAIGCKISGTSPVGFAYIAKQYGLKYHKVSGHNDLETIKNYVANGKPIIANVGNRPGCITKKTPLPRTCKFTKCGHYIVLSGWDAANNRFIVNDPGNRATHRYNGTWHEISSDCIFKGAYYIGN